MDKIADYDPENDILYVNVGRKAEHSVQIDDFVVDFSEDDEVVGLEVMYASRALSNLTDQPVGREDLENLDDAELRVREEEDAVYVTLLFSFERDGEEVREHASISLSRRASAGM